MCFRPPEAGAGEFVCKSCYTIVAPEPDGTCPECGEPMGSAEEVAAFKAAQQPAAPVAPVAPPAPKA